MSGSTLTPEDVTAALRRHLAPDVRCTGLERGPVGNGQETWFLTTTSPRHPQVVLRMSAAAGPLTWTDRRREATVMGQLAGTGVPVPAVLWVADPGDPLPRSHLAMERLPGSPASASRGADRRELLVALGQLLARLHARQPHGSPASAATAGELARWRARAEGLGALVPPLLRGLLAWLEADVPDDGGPAVLLWGDAGLHNTLADGTTVTGLLDWELSHAGHPLDDLAVAVWMEPDGAAEPLVDAYADAAGRPVDRELLDRFLVLASVTRSLMVLDGAHEVIEGRLHAPTLIGLALDLPVRSGLRAAAIAGFATAAPAPPGGQPAAEPGPAPGPATTDAALARFVGDEVLPAVADRRLRRELKVVAALLETDAARVRHDAAVSAARDAADRRLLDAVAEAGVPVAGGLGGVAEHVERHDVDPEVRARVRAHLVADLAARAATLGPLRRLFGG